ncbi:hypothetical protein PG994_000906 [Apiospora phragmitis]|uniref:Uncharacterized protein n=1 Tax=Apiospora phragmitis TaxID=2905665 RepID=A0ABR1WR28_9PEZI
MSQPNPSPLAPWFSCRSSSPPSAMGCDQRRLPLQHVLPLFQWNDACSSCTTFLPFTMYVWPVYPALQRVAGLERQRKRCQRSYGCKHCRKSFPYFHVILFQTKEQSTGCVVAFGLCAGDLPTPDVLEDIWK